MDENLKNFVGIAKPANIAEIDGVKTLMGPNSKPIQKNRTENGKFESLIAVGPAETPRYFGNDENHHIEIWTDANGKWEGRVMNLYEAYQLKREGKKVSQAMGAPNETFVMQLFKQDVFCCEAVDEKGPAQYWIVEAIGSNGQLAFVPLFDSRALSEVKKSGNAFAPVASSLQKVKARRVFLDVLGYEIVRKTDTKKVILKNNSEIKSAS